MYVAPTVVDLEEKLNPDIFSSKLENKEGKFGSGFFCMFLEEKLLEEEKSSISINFTGKVTNIRC